MGTSEKFIKNGEIINSDGDEETLTKTKISPHLTGESQFTSVEVHKTSLFGYP